MQDFIFSINVVAPLFLLMAFGYVLKQLNFISEGFLSEANTFVFKFALPLMLFQNIQTSFKGGFSDVRLIFWAAVGLIISVLLAWIIAHFLSSKSGKKGSIIQGLFRSNFIIYGLPLAMGIYGAEALGPISILMALVIPFFNVMAIFILTIYSEKNTKVTAKSILKEIIRNPLIIGGVVGILFGICQVKMPIILDKPLTDFAHMATPLALFVMGGQFTFRALKGNLRIVTIVMLLKLIVFPLIAVTAFVYLGFRNLELTALMCLFATPTAVSSYIMAENMGCDGEMSGQIVVLTTVCSSVTIFAFVYSLRSLGYL